MPSPSLLTSFLRSLPPAAPRFGDGADVVVVGTGAAGLSAALEAAAGGADVLVITKSELGGGSTPWAQGGLAAVLDPSDSEELHAADTLRAGAGLCAVDAVESLVHAAPGEIARLRELGARFDTGPLGLEGGHSRHRIVHAGGDASGAEVHRVLSAALGRFLDGGRLRLWSGTLALDLARDDDGHGRVVGVHVARVGEDGGHLEVGYVAAGAVVLATGGFGHAYTTTTNPAGVTGDGLALAARAGAVLSDVEFVQFHPTVLWSPGASGARPLVTEALRGAGATLRDDDGRPVMAGVHPLGDLAPRDVVAARLHELMSSTAGDCQHLWLDATRLGRRTLEEHFPTVTAACRRAGVDPVNEPIPVAPGAHYACGGVQAAMDGATSLAGLYAVGEVAATGVHGANRLASNSLTESLATGRRVGRAVLGEHRPPGGDGVGPPAGPQAGVDPAERPGLVRATTRHAGVVRDGQGLELLLRRLGAARAAVAPAGRSRSAGDDAAQLDLATVEATNLHTVSTLVALAALVRTESRGCHRRSDWPATEPGWARRVDLQRDDLGRLAERVGVSV